jgi:hypothetical protein
MKEALQNLLHEEVAYIDKNLCEYIEGMITLHKEKIVKSSL